MSEDVNYQIQSAQLGRIILVRLLPKADLIKTILKICEDQGIEYAYFNLIHGSFEKANFSVFTPKKGVERIEGYDWYDFALTEVNNPLNLLAGGGWVCDAQEPGKKEVVIHYCCRRQHLESSRPWRPCQQHEAEYRADMHGTHYF